MTCDVWRVTGRNHVHSLVTRHLFDSSCHHKYQLSVTTTIDAAGRIAPKCLCVARQTPQLVNKKGFLIHNGTGAADLDVVDFINRQRDVRATHVVRMP